MNTIQQIVTVSEGGRLALRIPRPAGTRVRVIVLDTVETPAEIQALTEEELFQLGVYAAVTEDDPEEDAIWERYLRD